VLEQSPTRQAPSARLGAVATTARREWIAWLAALALPLAALVVVRLAEGLDRSWRRDTAHFWLVLVDAVLAAGLGLLMSEAGRRRERA
jgi:hypothetical protein